MITLIAATDRNGAIGKDGGIPWDAPEDLKFFSRETRGGAVIMGRRTWDSLPMKPLPGRLNIVVTSGPPCAEHCAGSIPAAIEIAHHLGHLRIYGIGGSRIYSEMLPLADRLLLTRVDLEVEGADAFFPKVPPQQWVQSSDLLLRAQAPACRVEELIRL